MVHQSSLGLDIASAMAEGDRVRRAHREADMKAEQIRGLKIVIRQWEDALANNTYPAVGKGTPLLPEHRPLYEKQLADWRLALRAIQTDDVPHLPAVEPKRREAFAHAVSTARQHAGIQVKIHQDPSGFVIVDNGNEFPVYGRDNFERGQAPGGFLPASPINGVLVAYVALDGTVSAP